MSRKNKTISFNLEDEYELELLRYVEQINPLSGRERNFSKYVKRLIEGDIRGLNQQLTVEIIKQEEYTQDDKDAMSSFL